MEKSKDEFVAFIKGAIADPGSAAGSELNEFLISCFNNAAGGSSMLALDAMDSLVDEAAHLPRKLGFAPKNEDIYPTDAARKEARSKLFNVISSSGHVTVDQWVSWAKAHIAAKAPALP